MSFPIVEPGRWGAPFQRRRHARISVTLRAEYRIVGEPAVPQVPAARLARPGSRLRQTTATSVSTGGLRLESGERLPVGTRLALTVFVRGVTLAARLEPVACEARVVWTDIVSDERPDEYRCGVEFLDIAEPALKRLTAFIQAVEAAAAV